MCVCVCALYLHKMSEAIGLVGQAVTAGATSLSAVKAWIASASHSAAPALSARQAFIATVFLANQKPALELTQDCDDILIRRV